MLSKIPTEISFQNSGFICLDQKSVFFFFFPEQLLYIGFCSRPRKFYLYKEEKTLAIMETGEKDNNPINFNKEKTFQRQISALKKNMSGSWNNENCVHLISVQVASKNDI